VVFVRGMPRGRCDSMDVVDLWTWLVSPSFVLEVYFFVVFVHGMLHGRCDSMDVVDLSFLRAGGVFLRGVRSWGAFLRAGGVFLRGVLSLECPVGIMVSVVVANFGISLWYCGSL